MTMTVARVQDTVYALASSGAALYAARASGLYRSHDDGKTWHDALAESREPMATQAVAVTSVVADGSTVFAGMNGAVLRSDDGTNWQIIALASPAPQVSALTISPHFSEDGIVLAGTAQDGVFVSSDRGITFTPWNFGLLDPNVYALALSPDFSRDQVIFAGTLSGIFRSHNGGRSWCELSFPMDAAPVLCLALSAQGTIFAGTEAHGLFISDDNGESWRQASDELASVGINAIQIAGAQTWLLTEDRLLSSLDGGGSWQPHDPLPADKIGVAMLPHSGAVIVGCADGDLLHLS